MAVGHVPPVRESPEGKEEERKLFAQPCHLPRFLVATLLLVVRPGAPSSVLAPSSDTLCSQ